MRRRRLGPQLALALLGIAAATTTPSAPAACDPASPSGLTREISPRDAAELLLEAGRLDDARTVLLSLERVQPRDNQTEFMLGLIDVSQAHYAAAISRFRQILVREPSAVRVRLELARAFYLRRDYDNAERQFRFARAGDLPAAALTNIDRFLYAIRQLRRWSYDVAVGLAPNTNENAGSAATTVDLYGLPFQLSPDARKQSGVGFSAHADFDWSQPLRDHLKLRIGGQVDTTDYSRGDFDDTSIAAYIGPRIVTQRWDFSPLVTGFRRWYGGRLYNQGVGGSLEATYYPAPRVSLSAVIGGQAVNYGAPLGQSGPAASAALGFLYTASALSVLSGSFSATHQNASLAAYAFTSSRWQLTYSRDLPHGFSLSIQPSYARIDYDAPLAAFGLARDDRQWTAQATLLNRRIDLGGFTPSLLYAYTRNDSNIPLYTYDRHQFEVGLTRTF
jgi:tetratricopeptide (TPR) repeat protein